jgi:hypothetical protein
MGKSLFKATNHDLERLSAEELYIYQEIRDLLIADGMPEEEAEKAAYLSFFIK